MRIPQPVRSTVEVLLLKRPKNRILSKDMFPDVDPHDVKRTRWHVPRQVEPAEGRLLPCLHSAALLKT